MTSCPTVEAWFISKTRSLEEIDVGMSLPWSESPDGYRDRLYVVCWIGSEPESW